MWLGLLIAMVVGFVLCTLVVLVACVSCVFGWFDGGLAGWWWLILCCRVPYAGGLCGLFVGGGFLCCRAVLLSRFA